MRSSKVWSATVTAVLISTIAGVASYGNASASEPASKARTTPHAVDRAGNNPGLITPGILTVCSDTTYPPMEYTPPNHPGTYVGADVDLANAMARKIHLKSAKIIKSDFTTIIPALEAKRCDIIMSSMSAIPSRAKQVHFIPYMKSVEAVLVKKNSPIHSSGYKGLCGYKVSVESATTEFYGLTAQNKKCSKKMTILQYTADTDAFEAFKVGHADAYTGDFPVVVNYVKLSHGTYRQAGKPIDLKWPYGIALRKKGSTALEMALKGALKKIKKNGTYKRILKKWGVSQAAL